MDGDSDSCCILHSQNQGKDPKVFHEAILALWQQEEANYYDFSGVCFPGRFDPLNFFKTREFSKPVNFENAIFMGEANFHKAIFNFANFSMVIFKELVDFRGATFWGEANFSWATFEKEANFYKTTFIKEANFLRVKIYGWMSFREINPPADVNNQLLFKAIFNFPEISPKAVLVLRDLSLAHISFEGSDLRRIEFQHVKWHHYRSRQTIYDEILLRESEKKYPSASCTNYYGEVERLYRNLKINYENQGDFKNSGDFHYGEMEMHRRASKWRWFPFYWNNLYRVLSGYGERPIWALGWLAAFFMIFTCFLAWAGLEIIDPKHSANFGNSFFYLLQKVTLQRLTWAEPVGFAGKLVAGLSVLFIPGQAALFLLALRNRLGRRR